MSGTERDLNLLVRQNRESQVINLRGQLDAVRQKIANVKAGVSSGNEDLIARVPEGPARWAATFPHANCRTRPVPT